MKNIKNLPEKSGIYKITNLINGHSYIGQSKNIFKRFNFHHICDYKNPNSSQYNTKLYQAFRKYGIDQFQVGILELCDISQLDEKEIKYIKIFNTYKNGYNSTPGGQFWSENIHAYEIEQKRKITREKNKSLQGQKHPRAKLTDLEVINIRQRYINGEAIKDIYKDYNKIYSNLATFTRIVLGQSYKSIGNIPEKKDIRHTNGKLTANQVKEIRQRYANEKISFAKLGKEYGLSATTIDRIVKKITYAHID